MVVWERRVLPTGQAEEHEQPVLLVGIANDRRALKDMDRFRWNVCIPTAKLKRVLPSSNVREVLVGKAGSSSLNDLVLTSQPGGLFGYGGREVKRLNTEGAFVPIVRDGPIDRVSQQDDDGCRCGQVLREPTGRKRVEEEIGRPLS